MGTLGQLHAWPQGAKGTCPVGFRSHGGGAVNDNKVAPGNGLNTELEISE